MTSTLLRPSSTALRPLALAALAALASATAQAQNSPYYVGISQALAHESNIFQRESGTALPAGARARGDTIATTSLLAGLDQSISRQRVYASASLRHSQYSSNSALSNQGYSLNAGVDWATINRISGNVDFNSQRNLRIDSLSSGANKNIETFNGLSAVARVGVVTRLTAQAGLTWRQVRYSLGSFDDSEYDQHGLSAGVFYRVSGATQVGAGLRSTKTSYIHRFGGQGDDRDRRDLDLTVDWQPGESSSKFYGRVSYTVEDAGSAATRDYKGLSGEARVTWLLTGKTTLTGRLLRDTGRDAYASSIGNLIIPTADLSRTTTILFLGANHALTGKISLNAGLNLARNDRENQVLGVTRSGADTTTSLSLGARWQPTRAILVGCDVSRSDRNDGARLLGYGPYTSNGLSCFGQFMLQGI